MATQSSGFALYNLAYLELMPSFTCNYVGSTQQFSCQPEDFCSNPELEYRFDYSAENSIHNWVEKLNLTCRPGWQIGLLGSVYFMGWCCTLLWVPPLADKHGRKPVVFWGMLLNLIAFTLMIATRSYLMTLGMIFIMGAITTIRLPLISNYLVELVATPWRTFYITIWQMSESIPYIVATTYFLLDGKNSSVVVCVGYVFNVIAVAAIYFLPESPEFLY
jgi:MFS family permease